MWMSLRTRRPRVLPTHSLDALRQRAAIALSCTSSLLSRRRVRSAPWKIHDVVSTVPQRCGAEVYQPPGGHVKEEAHHPAS